MSLDRAFRDALVADPDDLAAAMAYADHLSESDDAGERHRGEFMRVQLALEDPSRPPDERAALRYREAELLHAHRRAWLGPLDDFINPDDLNRCDFTRGRLTSLAVSRLGRALAAAIGACEECDFLVRLSISNVEREMLEEDHPLFRGTAVRRRMIGEYPALAVLAESDRLRGLRSLALGEQDDEFVPFANAAMLPELLSRLHSLRELHLNSRGVAWAVLFAHPAVSGLEVLRLDGVPLRREGAEALSALELPRIRRVELWGAALDDAAVAALASAKWLGALEHLDVSFNPVTPAGLALLPRWLSFSARYTGDEMPRLDIYEEDPEPADFDDDAE